MTIIKLKNNMETTEEYNSLLQEVLEYYSSANIIGIDRDFAEGWFNYFFFEGERDATIIIERICREYESITN